MKAGGCAPNGEARSATVNPASKRLIFDMVAKHSLRAHHVGSETCYGSKGPWAHSSSHSHITRRESVSASFPHIYGREPTSISPLMSTRHVSEACSYVQTVSETHHGRKRKMQVIRSLSALLVGLV